MKEPTESRTFRDESGRLWEARYVPDWKGETLPDAKILEFVPVDLLQSGAPPRIPVRPGFLGAATEEQLRAKLAAAI